MDKIHNRFSNPKWSVLDPCTYEQCKIFPVVCVCVCVHVYNKKEIMIGGMGGVGWGVGGTYVDALFMYEVLVK